ncbi:MAG: SPASM domain-containing protein [Planctomycetota bacterium]
MGRTDLGRVETVIRGLHAARQRARRARPELAVNMVRHDEIAADAPVFLERWRSVADEIVLNRCRPPGATAPRELPFARVPCHHLEQVLVMTWDGTVGMCGDDLHAQNVFGRFPARSLSEIWRGEEIGRARRLHREGRWDEIPICSRCEAWSQVYNRVRHEEGFEIVEDARQTVYRPRRGTPPG